MTSRFLFFPCVGFCYYNSQEACFTGLFKNVELVGEGLIIWLGYSEGTGGLAWS